MKKFVFLFISICLILNINLFAYADTDANAKVENDTEITVQAEKSVKDILGEFKNNSDGIQKKAEKVIEDNSESFIVKIFKKIVDAISKVLDAIFKLALEVTKIR